MASESAPLRQIKLIFIPRDKAVWVKLLQHRDVESIGAAHPQDSAKGRADFPAVN